MATPLPKNPAKNSPKSYFEEFFKRCILFDGPKNCGWWQKCEFTKAGHARMHIGPRAFAVRRILIWLRDGHLPRGEDLSDTCGEPGCCNVDHIIDDTQPEDRIPRKTLYAIKPPKWAGCAITKEQAEWVDNQLLLGDITIKGAARKFGCGRPAIYSALKRLKKISGC